MVRREDNHTHVTVVMAYVADDNVLSRTCQTRCWFAATATTFSTALSGAKLSYDERSATDPVATLFYKVFKLLVE